MFRFHESHTDGRTDMMKVLVAFRNFANAHDKRLFLLGLRALDLGV